MIWRRILLESLGKPGKKRISQGLSKTTTFAVQISLVTRIKRTRWWSVGLLLYRNWHFSTPQYGAEAVLLSFCGLQHDGLSVDRHGLSWWFSLLRLPLRLARRLFPRLLISIIQCIHRVNQEFYFQLLSLMAFYFWWGTFYIVLNRYYQKHRVWYYIIISLAYAQRCYKADQYAVPNVSSSSNSVCFCYVNLQISN